MRPVRHNVAASLDGYIAGPRGEFDWIPNDPHVDFASIGHRGAHLARRRRATASALSTTHAINTCRNAHVSERHGESTVSDRARGLTRVKEPQRERPSVTVMVGDSNPSCGGTSPNPPFIRSQGTAP